MSLIFITGISTSGKSTIAKELSRRGYEAYDTEHNGISAWYNIRSGKIAAGFNEVTDRSKEWLDQHEWLISVDQVSRFKENAQNKPVFLCGGSANDEIIRDMCSAVVWLKTNEETIRRRVRNPRDHDYGTRPHELALAIASNKTKEAEYRRYGAIMIDATKPIETVAESILTTF